jgi:OOP family OmpA-OmpF porin
MEGGLTTRFGEQMKVRALFLAMTAAIALAPITVVAEPGQIFINPFVGMEWHESTQEWHGDRPDLDNSQFYGIGGEMQFNERFGAELQYSRDTDGKESNSDVGVDIDRVFLDGIYYTPAFGNFQPYVKLGLDHVKYSSDFGDEQGTEIGGGLGVRMLFNQHWSARFEAKALHELDNSRNNGTVSLGVSYAFGEKSKPAPVPVAAAVVAPVAPVDSDGDGVTDDLDKCPNTPRGREVDSVGCEYHLTKTEEMKLDILFVTNKADITEQYVGEVERAAKFLKRYADVKAVIEGHTDSDASDAYNQKLSQRRADAVKAALVTRYGVDAARLSAVGYGESRPVTSNATKEGKAQNRRVVAVMQAETTVPVMKK